MIEAKYLEKLLNDKAQRVGSISSFYGGVIVAMVDGRAYWGIENYDKNYWEEIPMSLYDELISL